MDQCQHTDAPPVMTDRSSWMLSDLLHHLTEIMKMLAEDARDRQIHRLDRYHVAQLAIQAAEAYGRLLNIHEVQTELDRTRTQLAELQARWDQANRERRWD